MSIIPASRLSTSDMVLLGNNVLPSFHHKVKHEPHQPRHRKVKLSATVGDVKSCPTRQQFHQR